MSWTVIVAGVVLLVLLSGVTRRRADRARLSAIERRVDVLAGSLGLAERLEPTVSEEVRQIAARGEKIQAIRMHRDAHPGMGLKAAKEAVEAALDGRAASLRPPDATRVVRKLDAILATFDLTPGAPDLDALAADVRDLARAGQTVEAIRRLRELRPELGLAEAKAIVDRVATE